MTDESATESTKLGKYKSLQIASGLGGILGSGCIVGLSATITVFKDYLHMTPVQVGVVSSVLTFAIGFGSLFGGRIADRIGRIRVYNYINFIYAIGTLLMAFAPNYGTLIVAAVILGLTSGTELPVSLAVMSRDAPNEGISNKLVSSHQIYWHFGQFISYLVTFFLSTTGILSARVVFIFLTIIALVSACMRTFSKTLAQIHAEGEARIEENAKRNNIDLKEDKVSVTKVLFGKYKKTFLFSLIGIGVYYVAWNLLANTWGQFQTYLLSVNIPDPAHRQTFATGIGLVLLCVATIMSVIFTQISASKMRKPLFYLGGAMQVVAMAIMAIGIRLGSGSLWFIVAGLAMFNIFNSFAGEAMYKVWTQNSFPATIRASVQGFINGFSRICCALFAIITPSLVAPDHIGATAWGFFAIMLVSFIAGVIMINTEDSRDSVVDKA